MLHRREAKLIKMCLYEYSDESEETFAAAVFTS